MTANHASAMPVTSAHSSWSAIVLQRPFPASAISERATNMKEHASWHSRLNGTAKLADQGLRVLEEATLGFAAGLARLRIAPGDDLDGARQRGRNGQPFELFPLTRDVWVDRLQAERALQARRADV